MSGDRRYPCGLTEVRSDLKAKNNSRHIHIQTSAFATYVQSVESQCWFRLYMIVKNP